LVEGTDNIFSVIEAIFPVVKTTVSATESIISEVEKILVASDDFLFATKSVFSVAEKTVGEAPSRAGMPKKESRLRQIMIG
jgi:hypothetical protein